MSIVIKNTFKVLSAIIFCVLVLSSTFFITSEVKVTAVGGCPADVTNEQCGQIYTCSETTNKTFQACKDELFPKPAVVSGPRIEVRWPRGLAIRNAPCGTRISAIGRRQQGVVTENAGAVRTCRVQRNARFFRWIKVKFDNGQEGWVVNTRSGVRYL